MGLVIDDIDWALDYQPNERFIWFHDKVIDGRRRAHLDPAYRIIGECLNFGSSWTSFLYELVNGDTDSIYIAIRDFGRMCTSKAKRGMETKKANFLRQMMKH